MKKPMPLPITLTDYILLDQMGYEVIFLEGKPVSVVPKGRHQISYSAGEVIKDIRKAFRELTKMINVKLPVRSEQNVRQ